MTLITPILFDFKASSKANLVLNRGLRLFENMCLSLSKCDLKWGVLLKWVSCQRSLGFRSFVALVEH